MPTDFNGQYIYTSAAALAQRLRQTLAQIEDMHAFLVGLTTDDLINAGGEGNGMTAAQADVAKGCITELHDLARKFAGTAGMTDSGLEPLDLPHDYSVLAARLIGPRVAM